MKISIITVTYDSASTIEQTIQSVVNQSYLDIEYIIVDGGSTDDTLRIIEKYKDKISKILSEKDNGLYDALNKGIQMATGDVIGFLHSDDFYIDSSVVQKYADTFIRNRSDAVYSDLYYVDKNNTDKIIRKWKSGSYKENSFIKWLDATSSNFFCKKKHV